MKKIMIIFCLLYTVNLPASYDEIKKEAAIQNKWIDNYWSQIPETVFTYNKTKLQKNFLFEYVENIFDKMKRKNITYTTEQMDSIIKGKILILASMQMKCNRVSEILSKNSDNFIKSSLNKTLPNIKKNSISWREGNLLTEHSTALDEYLIEQLSNVLNVKKDEIEEYYITNKDEFKTDDSLILYHVFIEPDHNRNWKEAETLAKETFDAIQNGENFAKYAEKYNSKHSRQLGGYVGYCKRGDLIDSLDKKVWEMIPSRTNEIELVKSERGWHIIKIEDYKPAGDIPFEKVKDNIKKSLQMKKAIGIINKTENFEQYKKIIDDNFIDKKSRLVS